jgi:hypothetical protein
MIVFFLMFGIIDKKVITFVVYTVFIKYRENVSIISMILKLLLKYKQLLNLMYIRIPLWYPPRP